MFITDNAFKSPISGLFGECEEQYWLAAEVALQHPWFLVTFRQKEPIDDVDAIEIKRTMLLADVADVECLAQQEAGGLQQFESAQVVTPGHLNGTDGWKMDPLAAVWTAEEPAEPGQAVEILETRAGVKYARSMLETPIGELRNQTLRCRFPAQKKA